MSARPAVAVAVTVGSQGTRAPIRFRARRTVAVLGAAALAATLLAGSGGTASAVNSEHSGVVSTDPADMTPHVMDGSVQGVTQLGDAIVAVGTFTRVRQTLDGPDIARRGIVAFDATTGAIDIAFDPQLSGNANSVDTDGTSIFVGGAFNSVAGQKSVRKVAKLTATGALAPGFVTGTINGNVHEVVVRGDRLFIGGAFTSVGGETGPRGALAALSTSTGALLADVSVPFAGLYNGGATHIKRFDVTPDGARLVALGNFTTVGGQARAQIAVLDVAPGAPATLASWTTDRFSRSRNSCAGVFDSFVRDVDISPDGSYFVVSTTGAFAGGAASGTLCDTISRWETPGAGAQQPSWLNYTGGDTSYGVAVTGTAVYVGGHFRWGNNPFQSNQAGPGAVPREGIAAVDPVNGLPLSWNPGRTRGVGAQAMFATPAGLWVGSDTDRIGRPRQTRSRIAFLPLAGGTTVADVRPAALPGDVFAAELGAPGVAGQLLRRPLDSSAVPTGPASVANVAFDWSTVRGAFLVNGTLYYGLANGGLYARTFVAATAETGAERVVNLYDDPETGQRIPFAIANATGMFYDTATHRLYYTLLNDARLFYRYFTPESEIVGAQTFVAAAGGVDFRRTSGMTSAGGKILYGSSTDGALRSVPFANGVVTGAAQVVSADGTWKHRALLVANG